MSCEFAIAVDWFDLFECCCCCCLNSLRLHVVAINLFHIINASRKCKFKWKLCVAVDKVVVVRVAQGCAAAM